MLWKPPEVSFLGGFFRVCGKGERVGMGRSLCVTTVWDRETQIFPRLEHPRISAGCCEGGKGLEKGKNPLGLESRQVLQDGTEAQLGWGFAALAGKQGLGGHILLL